MAEESGPKEKQIRIMWGSDEDMPSLYANHLFVSHAGQTEFHLVFGHLSPPLTIGLEESELPDSVKIKPVAKLVISPEAMRKFVKLLSENLVKFGDSEKEDNNE